MEGSKNGIDEGVGFKEWLVAIIIFGVVVAWLFTDLFSFSSNPLSLEEAQSNFNKEFSNAGIDIVYERVISEDEMKSDLFVQERPTLFLDFGGGYELFTCELRLRNINEFVCPEGISVPSEIEEGDFLVWVADHYYYNPDEPRSAIVLEDIKHRGVPVEIIERENFRVGQFTYDGGNQN